MEISEGFTWVGNRVKNVYVNQLLYYPNNMYYSVMPVLYYSSTMVLWLQPYIGGET